MSLKHSNVFSTNQQLILNSIINISSCKQTLYLSNSNIENDMITVPDVRFPRKWGYRPEKVGVNLLFWLILPKAA